jgi:hypothetical protein
VHFSGVAATALILGFAALHAQTTPAKQVSAPANIQSLKVTASPRGTNVEIFADRAVKPSIQQLEKPPRLVIDLPNSSYAAQRKRFATRSDQVSAVRIDQFRKTPPVTRIVVDLLQPIDYRLSGKTGHLVIALEPRTSEAPAEKPQTALSITQAIEPTALPVIPGASGAVFLAGRKIAAGASVTAGDDTALLRLGRGGQIRVCPGTSVTLTPSKSGQDLMVAMGTGAVETHYRLGASADSILTPDFRILLAGPGDFHFAISADARGNTCVRSLPGNTASIIVSELMDAGTYQVKPRERVLFRSGHINLMDIPQYEECGCPPPTVPVLRASAPPEAKSEQEMPESVRLAQPGDPVANQNPSAQMHVSGPNVPSSQMPSTSVAESKPNQIQVRVEAPIVYRTRTDAPAAPKLDSPQLPLAYAGVRAPTLTTALPPAPNQAKEEKAEKARRGVLGKVKGFFSSVFR